MDTEIKLPEKDYSLDELLRLIDFYVQAIESSKLSLLIFPQLQNEIFKELEQYSNKYMVVVNKYLDKYDSEKQSNVVVSLMHTKYYKQLKEHAKRGFMLPPDNNPNNPQGA